MIEIQGYLLNPLHLASISPVTESSSLHGVSTYCFKVTLSGGNAFVFSFDAERKANDELIRLRQLVDQASTRR